MIAPIPWLVYALPARSVWVVAVLSFVAGTVGRLGLILTYISVIPLAALLLWVVFLPLSFMAVVLLTRWLYRPDAPWLALLAYPVFSTASEFLFNLASPHGIFGSLGYALTDFLPLMQAASVGGVAALTFIGSLIPMAAALFIIAPRSWKSTALLAGLPLLAAVVFGATRLMHGYDREMVVALAAIDATQNDDVRDEATAVQNAQAYAALIDGFADKKPDFVVLPEKSVIRKPGWRDAGASVREAAERNGMSVVSGLNETLADGQHANVAELYRPAQPPRRYLKRKLIPGLEWEFITGADSLVAGNIGVAICKDMDFPALIRDYGRQGVELLLVPAWDFRADARLHSRMAVMRGVENGFAVARAGANGMLTVSDAYGRILAEQPTSSDRAVVMNATVGLQAGRTLYSRIGDAFGWLTVVGATLLIVSRFRFLSTKRVDGRSPQPS
ncbi:nitrilase-related carbon-nitrogen hydrolase [Mesorhizobium sp. INR15]|uniref:nitrilase-related carbon-nitrogen hydrolase n=1 Tax=Mesorhizobium sp. INR15 TaxID=2654248 RepID=UPI0018964A34|nr:nitrilase-related carbon-nitrogen hydrolase [Mesorhizobium sp. INR15]